MVTEDLILNGSIKLVVFQFSFSNPTGMPRLPTLPQERPEERQRRKELPPGRLAIPETPNVMAADFIAEVVNLGYRLVSGTTRGIPALKEGSLWTFRNRVRYVLIPRQDVDERRCADDPQSLMEGLIQICLDAMWTVKAYVNPYRKDDMDCSLNIVLTSRKPFQDRNGHPILVRAKDMNGIPIGDPEPLVPEFFLKVVDGNVLCIMSNR